MNDLDKAIRELNPLVQRKVIKELALLTRLYVKARAYKGLKRFRLETKARWTLCKLSDGAHAILEAAIRGGNDGKRTNRA